MSQKLTREQSLAQAVETQMRHWEMANQVAARRRADDRKTEPASLSVTISRQSGARGGSIARAVADRLGWQVYDQELIAYMASQMHVRQSLLEGLDERTLGWAREWLNIVLDAEAVDQESFIVNLTKVVLAIGLRGEAVFVGRGANFILPRDRTLTVRVVAPLGQRVGYVSQRERLSPAAAKSRVLEDDENRARFIDTYFHKDIAAPEHYDLTLDSCALGEEASAELILHAREARLAHLVRSAEPGQPRPPSW